MIQIKDDFAPYAPAPNLMLVINRSRTKRLPDPLDAQALVAMGIPMATAPRVLQALYFLGLVNEEGNLTSSFLEMAKVPDNDAMSMLAELVQAAYNSIFVACDPSQATKQELQNAFRRYEPRSQIDRMVTFFMALCKESGIVTQSPERVHTTTPRKFTAQKKSGLASTNGNAVKPSQPNLPNLFTGEENSEKLRLVTQPRKHQQYGLLLGFFEKLPDNETWSECERDRWLQAFTSTLDLVVTTTKDAGMTQKGSAAEYSAELPLQTS